MSDLGDHPLRAAAPRGFVPALITVLALLLAAAVVGQLTGSAVESIQLADFPVVAGVTFTLVGALVVPRQPRNPVGWLFVAAGLSNAVALLSASFSSYRPMAWLYAWLPAPAYGLLPLVLLLFPDGRLPSRSWRAVAWFAVVMMATAAVFLAVTTWADPLFVDPRTLSELPPTVLLGRVGLVGIILSIVAAVVSLVVRWRRATGDTRQQLKWLGLGAAFIPVGIAGQLALVPWAWLLPATTVPAAACVAMLRYRLYDVDLFLNRSLVYAALTVLVVAIYVGTVTTLGAVFTSGESWQRIAAAGVVAVVFGPLKERLQRGANRLLYGDRDDPYAVVSRLSLRLEQAVDPATVLAQVAETVADALHLPYAAIQLADGAEDERPVASHGRRIEEPEAFDMTYQGQVVGRLLVNPRSSAEPFTAAERSLLEDLARHAGLAVRTVGLTADLQRSRERLVRSREEERRRLRRDLHDGLGPALAGMTMQVGAARALLAGDPHRVEDLLGELEQQLQVCVKEIRQLVDNLRPSTLDRMGLFGAIRHRADMFVAGSAGSALTVVVTAPDELPELPAAVEVVAYRIAAEAITNAVRHAEATRISIRLALNAGLLVEVTDDGRGLPVGYRPGVGLTSMRERTEELGGTFVAERLPAGGTRIRAVLPLDVS